MHAVNLRLSPPLRYAPAPMPIDVKCTFDCDKWILSSDVAWPQLHWQAEVIHNHTETHSTAHTHTHIPDAALSVREAHAATRLGRACNLLSQPAKRKAARQLHRETFCKPACAGGSPPGLGKGLLERWWFLCFVNRRHSLASCNSCSPSVLSLSLSLSVFAPPSRIRKHAVQTALKGVERGDEGGATSGCRWRWFAYRMQATPLNMYTRTPPLRRR